MWSWLRRMLGETPASSDPVPAPVPGDEREPELQPQSDALTPPPAEPPLDAEALAIHADWLSEQGDPRGLLISAELGAHPALDRLVLQHLDAVMGPLLPVVEPLVIQHGRLVKARLRRLPSASERASEAWQGLERIEAAPNMQRALKDPRAEPTTRVSRVPQRFVPFQLVRAGYDRQLWLCWDTETGGAVSAVVPDPHQVIEPTVDGPHGERVLGAERFEPPLEPLPPRPWSEDLADAVGDHDPSQWVFERGGPRCLGVPRPSTRPRCVGDGWAGLCSRGAVRQVDEDGFHGDGQRFVVIDGMAGNEPADEDVGRSLEAFVSTSGLMAGLRAVHDVLDASYSGAAVVAAFRYGRRFQVAWSGDCRAYRVGPDRIEAVTRDHSLVESMIAEGTLRREEAATHPLRNVVTHSLGTGDFAVDTVEVVLQADERLLLCTDGLWRTLDDGAILRAVAGLGTSDAVERVVRRANALADDNLTAVLIEPIG